MKEVDLAGCACKQWGENLDKLTGFIVLGNAHGMEYDGEQFLYCPWCGKKRKPLGEIR